MIRRFGDVPDKGRSYRPRPGAYAVLARGRDVLVTFQSSPVPEIQLPGGGIDPGENPIQALHREVLEETGWAISAPRRIGAFRRFAYMPEYDRWADKLCHIYLARPVLRHSDPIEPDHEAVWLSCSEAYTALGNDGDRHFLGAVFGLDQRPGLW